LKRVEAKDEYGRLSKSGAGRSYSISDELIGRFHDATEDSALDLVFCYRKSHLRRIGLAIATTCDLNSLVQEWGVILGQAVFAKSREPSEEPGRTGLRLRPKITLARSAGRYFPPPTDLDDVRQPVQHR
jgi:hypothetical protein